MAMQQKVEHILKQVAECKDISNYELTLDEDILKGDGFLSEFYTGKVRNKDTGVVIEIYIKVPPNYQHLGILPDVYSNEFNYYSKIYPELVRFQREKGVNAPFSQIPTYYCGGIEPGSQYLALENLKVHNYVLHDKSKSIDENHLKLIFKTYGKYHALTFAFKDQHPEKYEQLIEPLKYIFPGILKQERVQKNIKGLIELAREVFQESDDGKNAEKITSLIESDEEITNRGLEYDGKYSTLVHGDCWSNNIMFKYNKQGEIEDIKLIDHQLAYNSTPVHDLSYFFYSGASKNDFDKLDEYLELYHKSFSSFARELGSDPEKLFPFEALKSDWKKYSFLGINMGLMIWQVKLMSKEKIQSVSEGNAANVFHENSERLLKSDTFKQNISNILLHAIEYGII